MEGDYLDNLVMPPNTAQVEKATHFLVLHDYGSILRDRCRPSFRQSLLKSVWTGFTLNVAAIPIALLMILLLYLDMNTANLCFELKYRQEKLPAHIIKWILIGHNVEAIAINLWFQCMLILLFGWQKFKSHHLFTILLGFLLGCTVAIYKTILFTLNLDFTKEYYRYPGNFLFLVGVVCTSYLVAKKICTSDPTVVLKKGQIFIIISTQYFLGSVIGMAYRYAIVPWFNRQQHEIHKAIIALIAPILVQIPMVICEHLALKSSTFSKSGRTFVLIYVVNGVSAILYCIMQADVKSIWIFTALSLFRGFLQVLMAATAKLRHKIFVRFWKCLRSTCYCIRLGQLPLDIDQHRRLRVDKEVQVMLYQNIALVLSQAYRALYQITNFHYHLWGILEEPVQRVCIGLGISFFANWLSILTQIHWRNTKLQNVWFKHWKLHMLAVSSFGAITVLYFTSVLLTVFQGSADVVTIKNCTSPL